MPQISRRTLLQLTASSIPLLAMGCAGPVIVEDIPESLARFPRTPISGDMSEDRAVLTFFVADDSPVTLWVWNDDGLVLDRAVASNGDGFHKVMLDALEPGTRYHWAVLGGEGPRYEDRSLVCSFRTAYAEGDLPVVRVALLSCIGRGTILPDYYFPEDTDNPTEAPFEWPLLQSAAALGLELDALVHLGDQAYLDFVWSREDGTLEAYLSAWGWYHGGDYRQVYPLAGLYATWDDHESTDNSNFDPWDMSAEDQQKLANAHSAWYRVIPIDAEQPEDGPVWRSFQWGDTVELILLDCRYELQPDRQLSDAQLDWLVSRIEASPCRFLCIATPKPFSQITSSSVFSSDNADRWENYPPDRDRVREAIDALADPRVVFVTGDIHMNYLGRTTLDGTAASERCWEVCCTSGNYSPLASSLSEVQFDFVSPEPHFPVLSFDPDSGTVEVTFYDVDGNVAFSQVLDDFGPSAS